MGFRIENGVLKGYTAETGVTKVIIPHGVTSIGDDAFYNCSSLVSITIPAGVTSIGDNAFYNCSSLVSITIPAGVTSIGDNAFSGCEELASITIPDSVTSIGDNAFFNCYSLVSVTIPAGVTSIGKGTFSWCDELTRITIPDSVTSIEEEAFKSCRNLKYVAIPKSLTNIAESAFNGCEKNIVFCSLEELIMFKMDDEIVKNNMVKLLGALINIIKSKMASELKSFRLHLDFYNSSWKKNLVASIDSIFGNLPVVNENDQRLKKAIRFTESFFSERISDLIKRTKRFDKVCSDYQEYRRDITIITEIINLINAAAASSNMEYIFTLPVKRIVVNYKTPFEILELQKKWNKIRNDAVMFPLQQQKENISAIVRLNETLTEKYKEREAALNVAESAKHTLNEAETALDTIKDLNGKKIEDMQTSIAKWKAEIQGLLQELDAARLAHQDKMSEAEQRLSELQEKAAPLSENAEEYKLRAIKSLLFKKKNKQLADHYADQLGKVTSEIDRIQTEIEANNALLNEKQADFERNQKNIDTEIQNAEKQMEDLSSEINFFENDVKKKEKEYRQCALQYDNIQKEIEADIDSVQRCVSKLSDKAVSEEVPLEKMLETIQEEIADNCLRAYPIEVGDSVNEISLVEETSDSSLGCWINSCFDSYLQWNNKKARIYAKWSLLLQRADAEKSLELTERYDETQKAIQEIEYEYDKCCANQVNQEPYIISREDALLVKIEEKFRVLMKYLSDGFVPSQDIMPFCDNRYCLSMSENTFLWFCPYYFILVNEKDNRLSVQTLSYTELQMYVEPEIISLDYDEKVQDEFEVVDIHWEYKRADGQRNMRYKDNRARSDVKLYVLSVSVHGMIRKIYFSSAVEAEKPLRYFEEFTILLNDEKTDRIINEIFQCENTPDIVRIYDDLTEKMNEAEKAQKQAAEQAIAEQELALKREKEARESALKKAEEERRIKAQREKELEEKRILLQHQISSENELINKNENIWRAAELMIESNCKQIMEKCTTKVLPLEVNDKRRVITNGITKISFRQSSTENCQKNILWFVNANGQRISNMRLIPQKSIGETTVLQFELKSQSGFSSAEDYFLCILNFEDGSILGAIPYKIKISFANDFGF